MLDKVGDTRLKLDETLHGQSAIDGDLPEYAHTPRKGLGKSIAMTILQAILVVALLIGSFFAANRMIEGKPEKKKRPVFKTVYAVNTVTAKALDHRPTFTSYGQTVAARNVELRALVPGEIVSVNPKLRSGARVSAGEALVTIDDFDYQAALAQAQANLAEARARIIENDAQIALERSRLKSAEEQLAFAMADFERTQSLRKRRTATQKQLDDSKFVVSQREQARLSSINTIKVQEARREQLNASITRMNWGIKQAERNLASTVLKAPFAAVIRSGNAEVGRKITTNDLVVSLYEAGMLEAKFTLTDAQYGRLQTSREQLIGRVVEVVWTVGGQDYTYKATIDRVGAEIASNRGGVEMFARVEEGANQVTIRPGAFVEVRVPDKLFTDTIAIPDTALYGSNIVYSVVDGRLVENRVKIAAFDGETILVADGLKAGDQVLTTRITEVSAGLRVAPEGESTGKSGSDR